MECDNKDLEYRLKRYQAVLLSQIYGVILVDKDGQFELINQALCNMFGLPFYPNDLLRFPQEEIIETLISACADPEEALERVKKIQEVGKYHVGAEVLLADGRVLLADFIPIVIDGQPSGSVWQFRDITEQKQAQALLTTERQRLAYILEGADVGTWEWNVQTGELIVDDRWAEITGYTLAELSPISIETWLNLINPDDISAHKKMLEKHFNNEIKYFSSEIRMRHKNGSLVWALNRGKVVKWTNEGKPLLMCGTIRDITERKLAEEKIIHLATHDTLTGLPSLRIVKDRMLLALGLARRHNSRAAVLFIDLDGFKKVNDTFGHSAGDYTLTVIAERLLSCMREIDTVARVNNNNSDFSSGTVARIGGDEFLIIASDLHSYEDAASIANRAVQLASLPVSVNAQEISIGASIGIALYPDDAEDIDLLIKLADQAMYKAKNSGGNSYFFAKDLTQQRLAL